MHLLHGAEQPFLAPKETLIIKSTTPKFSERFCDSRKIREDRETRRYYGGAGGFTFVASVAKNGAVRDGWGNVRGYVTSGRYRRSQ